MDQNNFNAQSTQTVPQPHPDVVECVDKAFGKSLAATIISEFPIGSIIAIFLGNSGLKAVEEANALAAGYGTTAGGKNIAAKVLGRIGKIVGIVMTVFWALYSVFYTAYIVFLFSILH